MSSLRFVLAAAAVLASSAARVAVASYHPPRPELQNGNLRDQLKTQRYGAAADDGLAVAYLPAYAIPDGSPVDPCVTCRPRRTTHNCPRNTNDGGCPARSTKRCGPPQSPAGTTKRRCSTPSFPRPAAAALSSPVAGNAAKRGPSVVRTASSSTGPKRFVSNVL